MGAVSGSESVTINAPLDQVLAAIRNLPAQVAGPGASITMPIGNKDDRWVFDDMDAAEACIPDAPRSDEMVVVLVLSAGGRPHARVKKPGA